MENASKALLIAAEILIGIMVIGIFVLLRLNMGETASTYDRQLSQVQMDKFNSYFHQFGARKDIKPQEVVSAIEYAREFNNGATPPIIEVTVSDYAVNMNNFDGIKFMQEKGIKDKKTYKCEIISYDNYGMINKVRFTVVN